MVFILQKELKYVEEVLVSLNPLNQVNGFYQKSFSKKYFAGNVLIP